jgi:hypothetical protein
MGADLYRGVLPAKLVELMATAVDASCTHLYAPRGPPPHPGRPRQQRHHRGDHGGLKMCSASASTPVNWARRSWPRNWRPTSSDTGRDTPSQKGPANSGVGGRGAAGEAGAHIPNGIPSCGVRAAQPGGGRHTYAAKRGGSRLRHAQVTKGGRLPSHYFRRRAVSVDGVMASALLARQVGF